MDRRAIITVAGFQGSGKSSTARCVAERLNFKHFSSGDLFREIAKERGLSIEAINLTAEEQKEIDYAVDERLKAMAKDQNLVIDSRLAFHWIPDSFKVFLALDPDTAAERIFRHIQTEGRTSQSASSIDEVKENIEIRRASEKKRYWDLYTLDPMDPKHFDMVIDTKENSLETVVEKVLEGYSAWMEK
jgi:cytidylate kinase